MSAEGSAGAPGRGQTVYVAGHRGMVGSAIVRRLGALGYDDIITAGSDEVDLRDPAAVRRFFAENAIDQVYLSAAKVGGISGVVLNLEPGFFYFFSCNFFIFF